MENNSIKNLFLNEKFMKIASGIPIIGGIASILLLFFYKDITLLVLFEKIIKLGLTFALYWAFSHYHWDVMRGLMGGLLFSLMYGESFLVLGSLWGDSSYANTYLIMGVQGSLYVAAESMSFLMTIIITLNHFVMNYGKKNTWRSVIFNQIAIIFKILLFIALGIINIFLELPRHIIVNEGIEYLIDLCIIFTLICIESQLEDLKMIRRELLDEKKKAGGQR